MITPRARFLGVLLIVAAGTACSDSPTSPNIPRDTLTLTSIAPTSGTLIPPGQSTRFSAVVRLEFATATRGTLHVAVSESWHRSLFGSGQETLALIEARPGEISVSVDVAVPPTAGGGTLDLDFFVVSEGATQASASVAAHYGVAS